MELEMASIDETELEMINNGSRGGEEGRLVGQDAFYIAKD